MRILYASNYAGMYTGYATIAKNLLPRLQERTDHEFVHFAVSGLQNCPPFHSHGVKVYGRTNRGGDLGVGDIPIVHELEDIDLVHMNFDAWTVNDTIKQYDFPYTIYPPIDHDPMPDPWHSVLKRSAGIVPYCKFGERVMREFGEEEEEKLDQDKIHEPIYHGVDTDQFEPQEISKPELFGGEVDEDTFVIMINKNNQGTRAALERMMNGFSMFLQDDDVDRDDVILYLNSNIQGSNAFDLNYVMKKLNIIDNVHITRQLRNRYGLSTEELAEYYSASDVLLNTTRGEGFGLPILEAMACGTPVIATAFSSMPELLHKNEHEEEVMSPLSVENIVRTERGLLCPVHDTHMTLGKHGWRREIHAQTIAAALKYAYMNRDEMAEKGETAREWAQQYDWDIIADQWATFFDQMEDEIYTEEDIGGQDVEWTKLANEDEVKGGVGAFQ